MRIHQSRILEWVAMPSSRGSTQHRDRTQVLCIAEFHQESPRILEWVAYPFSRGSSQPRNQIGVSWIAGGFFTINYGEAQCTCCKTSNQSNILARIQPIKKAQVKSQPVRVKRRLEVSQ